MRTILSLQILCCFIFPVQAQVTYLDSTFNASGILALNHTGAEDHPNISLTRPNGKSLEIGFSYFDTRTPATTLTAATIVQFDLNGQLDPGFGENGIVVLDDLKTDASAEGAVLQPDGKLLVTGKYLSSYSGIFHFIVRLNEDGSNDAGFGNNGVTEYPDPALVVWGSTVALQPDGKILMGGTKFTYVPPPGSGYFDFTLIRFNTDGSVDSDFGNNGIVVSDFTPLDWPAADDALAIAVGPDSMIYAGCIGGSLSLVARYSPNGDLDADFGIAGLVTLPDNGGVRTLLIQPDGRIIAGGSRKGSSSRAFIRRLNPDGALDPTFEAPTMLNGALLSGIVEAPDGKIIAGTFNYRTLHLFAYFPDGQLDTNFNKLFVLGPSGYFFNTNMMLQPDGKIMVGGTWHDDFLFNDFCLLRLSAGLTIDSTYGTNGVAIHNFGTNHSSAKTVLIDNQNQIVVGGDATYIDGTTISNIPTVNSTGFVSRFQANGVLDSTFSDDGFKPVPTNTSTLNLIALQPDGKILSAGGSIETFSGSGFTVARLLPDGSLDTAFGPYSDGISFVYMGGNIYDAYTSALALTPDSAIIVMGKTIDAQDKYQIALVRLDRDGWLDELFGSSGIVYSDIIPNKFNLNAGIVQPDGKILVGGSYPSPVPNIFLMRFMPDGNLDTSFGTGGVVFKPFTGSAYFLQALALQADGQIVLCGYQGSAVNSNLIVGRLNPDGTKDITFNGDGVAVLNAGTIEIGNALAVQADGKIVVVGRYASSANNLNNNPMLVRLLSDGTPDSSFAGSGYVITTLPGDNQLNALAVQPDGSYIAVGYSNDDYLLMRYLSKLSVGLLEPPTLNTEVLVYPNPVKGSVTFAYTLPAPAQVTLELFDIQGKLCHIFLQQENRPQGENAETLKLPQTLMPGVYILKAQTERGSKSVRVVVE